MRLGNLANRVGIPLLRGSRRLDKTKFLQLLEHVREGERLVKLEGGGHTI